MLWYEIHKEYLISAVNICYYLSRSDKKSTEVNAASDDDTSKDSFVTKRELCIDSRSECGDE